MNGTPLTTVLTPLSTVPVPLLKVAVSWMLPPAVIDVLVKDPLVVTKLVIVGNGSTVTVAVVETLAPAAFTPVSV